MFQKKKFLLVTTLLSYSLFAHAGFEAEPNNTTETATPMRLNEIFTGNFDDLAVKDNYKLVLTTPTEIKFHFKFFQATTNYFRSFRILPLPKNQWIKPGSGKPPMV